MITWKITLEDVRGKFWKKIVLISTRRRKRGIRFKSFLAKQEETEMNYIGLELLFYYVEPKKLSEYSSEITHCVTNIYYFIRKKY